MITIRSSEDRGKAKFDWLDSKHTFSFGSYYDPHHMGFASLRVINEDRILGGKGFPRHGHRDMEIITYVLSGSLEHQDSLGNGSIMKYGDVQRMSAGTGILHSEYNASARDEVHLLQIWIEPQENGLEPSYEQKFIAEDEKRGNLRLIGSPDGKNGSVIIHQDVYLYATILDLGEEVNHILDVNRRAWIHVARGAVEIMGKSLKAGDAIAFDLTTENNSNNDQEIKIKALEADAEILLFDLV